MSKKMTLFEITAEDAQFSAKFRIGRKLTDDELKSVSSYLRYAFDDWGIVLKEAILKITGKNAITEN